MRKRRNLYPEGESPAIPKPEVTPNAILDNPELFNLQASAKANLKEFSFTLFSRTFRFETYTIKKVHRITDCDEILCSNEAIMERVLRDNLTPEQHAELIEISGFSYKKNVLGKLIPVQGSIKEWLKKP
tara:strand:+ start:4497 stop:4883 length:387 start_codon:yes stop_codon:yes gene_type:complete